MTRTWAGLWTCMAMVMGGCAGSAGTASTDGALTIKVATGSFSLVGVTADNWAIVTDAKTHATNAVNLATGATQTIVTTPLVATQQQWVVGNTVVLTHNLDAAGDGANLTAWTSTSGATLLSSNATVQYQQLRPLGNGSRIAWFDHVDADTDALMVDNPTHTAPQLLVRVSSACTGVVQQTASRVVASYCTLPPAGGTSDKVVTAFNLPSGTAVTLQTGGNALGFRVDPTGNRALVRGPGGAASLVSLDGTQRSAVASAVSSVQWFNDGVELAFTTPDGALARVCNTGVPETLVPSGVGGVLWFTGDSTALAYFTNVDATSGNYDIRVASMVAPGAPLVLNGDGSGRLESFSGDSKHALFYNAVEATGHVGTFTTMPLDGGPGRILGSGQSVVDGDWETPTTKVVFNDRWVPATPTVPEHVALEVADVGTGDAPTQLAASADPYFWMTSDWKTVVYTSNDPAAPGLYTVAVP